MNLSFKNPAMIAATVVLAIAAIIFGSSLFTGAQAGGCGTHQGSSQSGQGCSMMGGSGSEGCSMSKDGSSGCTMLSGKVVSVDRDGTLTVRVKPAANTPDATKKAIRQLKSGDEVSMMMMGKAGSGTTATSQKVAKYTCPMHPEVTSDKPGQCPKCGMNLEPVNPQSK